jgi:hypothetical protein
LRSCSRTPSTPALARAQTVSYLGITPKIRGEQVVKEVVVGFMLVAVILAACSSDPVAVERDRSETTTVTVTVEREPPDQTWKPAPPNPPPPSGT